MSSRRACWGGVVSIPLLAACFPAMGIFGGWLILVVFIGVDNGAFWSQMRGGVDFRVTCSTGSSKLRLRWRWRSSPFRRLRLCHRRRRIRAITRTVVSSALAILALDFVMTSFMFRVMMIARRSTCGSGFSWRWVSPRFFLRCWAVFGSGNPVALYAWTPISTTSAVSRCGRRSKPGVLVGRVEQIRLDNERFQAEVVFTVDRRYKFRPTPLPTSCPPACSASEYIGLDRRRGEDPGDGSA